MILSQLCTILAPKLRFILVRQSHYCLQRCKCTLILDDETLLQVGGEADLYGVGHGGVDDALPVDGAQRHVARPSQGPFPNDRVRPETLRFSLATGFGLIAS